VRSDGKYKYRVLVADDDQEVREMFLAVLSCDLQDCSVDLVINGAEVIGAFRSEHYDVIVIDVLMPMMGGEKAFIEIQKICKEEKLKMPCFVFCSGYDAPPSIRKLIDEDPRHCVLRKPVDPDDLVQALKNRLGL
jgi:CheY-like chemotaxis protein